MNDLTELSTDQVKALEIHLTCTPKMNIGDKLETIKRFIFNFECP